MKKESNGGESGRRVLAGLRVMELGHYVAAPFASRLLADLGADIVKVEPLAGDPARQWGEQVDGHSLWWSSHARNKRCVSIDLKHRAAPDVVKRIAGRCDAVIENFRPGQLDRLGIGPDALRAVRPGLIFAHISGYGQTGPDRDRAAFGVIGEAIGGLRHLTDHPPGRSDLPPVRVGISIGDSVSGLYAAIGLLAALWQRDRSGGDGGERAIDVALTESMLSLMEGMLPEYGMLGKVKQPTGGGIATAAPTNAYPSSDGGWVLIAANSEPLFAKLMTLIGRPEIIGAPGYRGNQERVANVAELDHMIGEWTRRHTAADLVRILSAGDIPSSKVYDAADIAGDAQYASRDMVRPVDDPFFDRPVLHPGVVPRIAGDADDIRWAGPAIGAHTDDILENIAGFSVSEIADLRNQGVVG